MKKTYTKKQIVEAIDYWQKQLDVMNESDDVNYVKMWKDFKKNLDEANNSVTDEDPIGFDMHINFVVVYNKKFGRSIKEWRTQPCELHEVKRTNDGCIFVLSKRTNAMSNGLDANEFINMLKNEGLTAGKIKQITAQYDGEEFYLRSYDQYIQGGFIFTFHERPCCQIEY